jgi:WhiB family redox-sensing transcriptional regulator
MIVNSPEWNIWQHVTRCIVDDPLGDLMEAARKVPLILYEQGSCRGTPVDDWFGSTGGAGYARQRSICDGCPVKVQCYDYAIADASLEGVWAGTTKSEREAIIWPHSQRSARRRGSPAALNVRHIIHKGRPTWDVSLTRLGRLSDGARIRVTKGDLGDALEAAWTQAAGIPTALAMIEQAMLEVPRYMREAGFLDLQKPLERL